MLPPFLPLLTAASPLDRMVASERAFARYCGQVGVRDAFLRYFADDAVLFAPGPTNARASLRNGPKDDGPPRVRLNWWPTYADVSASGDLGYSTGPIVVHEVAKDKRAYTGHYFSLWRSENGRDWSVVLDLGTSFPAKDPSLAPTEFRRAPALGTPPATPPEGIDAVERRFAERSRRGHGSAVGRFAAPGARIFRAGKEPLAAADVRDEAAVEGWEPAFHAVSRAGDLGYGYGAYRRGKEAGSYVHVWRRAASGAWRLAVEILGPAA